MDDIKQRSDRIDVDAANHGGFFRVGLGNNHASDLASARFDCDWQGATHAANSTIERKFSDEKTVGNFFLCEAAIGSDNAEGHGQVES